MALTPNLFVYEFISGGGWSQEELPPDLSGEALAMLWAVLADFRALEGVHTLTTLDCRIDLHRHDLPADEVILIRFDERELGFAAILERSDAALIIAPETNGILAHLSQMVEDRGIPLLGSRASAIKVAGDKEACYRLCTQAGLPTPLTLKTSIAQIQQATESFGFPLVIKPLDGVGSEGVCLLNGPSDLDRAVNILRRQSRHAEILLQKYVLGEHASVSLLVTGQLVLPLSLNSQQIEIGCPFTYKGGVIPLDHPLQARAFENACKVVRLIPGLQGYVGIDMILDSQEAWVIEVNPRITTSYIGLRQVLGMNLAGAIYEASIHGVLPEHVQLTGRVRFAKNDLNSGGL